MWSSQWARGLSCPGKAAFCPSHHVADSRGSFHSILASYVALVILAMLTEVLSHYMHLWGSLRASRDIHKRLMGALLGATIQYVASYVPPLEADLSSLSWLDTTPTSRVISRCTGDIGASESLVRSSYEKSADIPR